MGCIHEHCCNIVSLQKSNQETYESCPVVQSELLPLRGKVGGLIRRSTSMSASLVKERTKRRGSEHDCAVRQRGAVLNETLRPAWHAALAA